jgi:hypothetical protein
MQEVTIFDCQCLILKLKAKVSIKKKWYLHTYQPSGVVPLSSLNELG